MLNPIAAQDLFVPVAPPRPIFSPAVITRLFGGQKLVGFTVRGSTDSARCWRSSNSSPRTGGPGPPRSPSSWADCWSRSAQDWADPYRQGPGSCHHQPIDRVDVLVLNRDARVDETVPAVVDVRGQEPRVEFACRTASRTVSRLTPNGPNGLVPCGNRAAVTWRSPTRRAPSARATSSTASWKSAMLRPEPADRLTLP